VIVVRTCCVLARAVAAVDVTVRRPDGVPAHPTSVQAVMYSNAFTISAVWRPAGFSQ
jgi:hypothetical protein